MQTSSTDLCAENLPESSRQGGFRAGSYFCNEMTIVNVEPASAKT